MSDAIRTIVAVEDEETDRFILQTAFQRAKLPHQLVILRHGRECVAYLSGHSPYERRELNPLPALLLLDLKMPLMDGFEVLDWLSGRTDLKEIPAVVLSSSSDESDVRRARDLGAREYFVKPLMLADLVKILVHLDAEYLS